MALKPCRECKQEISTEAKVCPHCGVPEPTKAVKPPPTKKESWIGLIVLVVIILVGYNACTDSDEEKAVKAAAQAKKDADCVKELSCIGERLVISSFDCQKLVERSAKNSMKWTDGTMEMKFSRYRWKDSSRKAVVIMGDKAQFQNGFGAMINMVYECEMDVATRAAVNIKVREGRF